MVFLAKMAVDEGWIGKLEIINRDEEVKEFILLNKSDFTNRFNNFIKLYGDRTTEELKLETKTFRSNPKLWWRKLLSTGKI